VEAASDEELVRGVVVVVVCCRSFELDGSGTETEAADGDDDDVILAMRVIVWAALPAGTGELLTRLQNGKSNQI